ncbi:MAG: hypothetical protein Kow00109_23190 [Acidobacteriota bacterium]
MNHFISLVLFSISVSAVFATLNRETRAEQFRYFFQLLGYMIGGALAVAWVMYFLPW